MRNICVCDKCENEFVIEEDSLKAKTIDDVNIKYFKCPYCSEKFIYIVEDKYTLQKQNKIKNIQEKLKEPGNKKADKLYKNMKKIMKDVFEYQRRLKTKYKDF